MENEGNVSSRGRLINQRTPKPVKTKAKSTPKVTPVAKPAEDVEPEGVCVAAGSESNK